MKKVKLFLLSGFLVILTVMSFAFRERFTSYSLWVKYGSSYIELATSGSNPGFSTTGLMPCRVKDGKNNDAFVPNAKQDPVGKPGSKQPSDISLPVTETVDQRVCREGVDGEPDHADELGS